MVNRYLVENKRFVSINDFATDQIGFIRDRVKNYGLQLLLFP